MDDSASVPFCKRGLKTLYALANSNRSVPLVESSARKANPGPFVFSRIRNREAAGYLMKVYRLTAWMMISTNFAIT
jgi:hypothetical protein